MVALGADAGVGMRSGNAAQGSPGRPGIGVIAFVGRSSVCAEILPELSRDLSLLEAVCLPIVLQLRRY